MGCFDSMIQSKVVPNATAHAKRKLQMQTLILKAHTQDRDALGSSSVDQRMSHGTHRCNHCISKGFRPNRSAGAVGWQSSGHVWPMPNWQKCIADWCNALSCAKEDNCLGCLEGRVCFGTSLKTRFRAFAIFVHRVRLRLRLRLRFNPQ